MIAPTVGGLAHRVECFWQVSAVLAADRGNRNQVGADEVVEAVVGGDRRAHRGAQGLARLRAADLEVEVGHAVGGAVDAEHLADDAELEYREAVQHQC